MLRRERGAVAGRRPWDCECRAGGLDPSPEEVSLVSSDGRSGLSFQRLGQGGLQDCGGGGGTVPGAREQGRA